MSAAVVIAWELDPHGQTGEFSTNEKRAMPDKCPWCGADQELDGYLLWMCGSTRLARSPGCYESQIARMQPVVDALGTYITDLRSDTTGMDRRWLAVSDAWDKYKESDQCNPS